MAEPPDRRGSISRSVLVAIAIGIAVIALVAALVWRPLATSLHLALAPSPPRSGHAPADAKALPAGAARAP